MPQRPDIGPQLPVQDDHVLLVKDARDRMMRLEILLNSDTISK
jgi:hypothetical protein